MLGRIQESHQAFHSGGLWNYYLIAPKHDSVTKHDLVPEMKVWTQQVWFITPFFRPTLSGYIPQELQCRIARSSISDLG